MENMVTYVRKTPETFQTKSWNDVDCLVLCQLVYLKFEDILPVTEIESSFRRKKERVTLKCLDNHPEKEKLFRDERYAVTNRALWNAVTASPRFSALEVDYVVASLDLSAETQFCAVTFFLPDGRAFVAFRGTDESIVGWKEDFNLAFSKTVPAQEKSVIYLNKVAGKIKGAILTGGHSKGGNLAIYAAMNCKPSVQKRLEQIYSMDGPGFRTEILEQGHYDRIAARVKKILPQSSLVGMLFERSKDFEVIESRAIGLLQHDPMSWVVRNGAFVRSKKMAASAMRLDDTINDWLDTLDEEHTRVFVNTIFEVLNATESDNLIDLGMDRWKHMQMILSAMAQLDDETKEAVKSVFHTFFELSKEHLTLPKKNRRKNI